MYSNKFTRFESTLVITAGVSEYIWVKFHLLYVTIYTVTHSYCTTFVPPLKEYDPC